MSIGLGIMDPGTEENARTSRRKYTFALQWLTIELA